MFCIDVAFSYSSLNLTKVSGKMEKKKGNPLQYSCLGGKTVRHDLATKQQQVTFGAVILALLAPGPVVSCYTSSISETGQPELVL